VHPLTGLNHPSEEFVNNLSHALQPFDLSHSRSAQQSGERCLVPDIGDVHASPWTILSDALSDTPYRVGRITLPDKSS
jgi:hypothetical protein